MTGAHEAYTLLLTLAQAKSEAEVGVRPEQVRISFGPQHGRLPHSELDALIDERWSAAVEANPRIFDGSKFRLKHIAWSPDGQAVGLQLGLTGYKEYLGTNRLEEDLWRQLRDDGERVHGDAAAHLSNALGCEAIFLTSDGQAVMLRRSGAVGTHSGLYNGPSGHPEPSHAGLLADGCDSDSIEERVCQELFDSVLQEVHEETNVPREVLSPPRLIGCMADATGKPDIIFLVRTSMDSNSVRDCYSKGAVEGWESDRLTFQPVSKLAECELPMTAVTRAAVDCFLTLLPPGVEA